MQLIVWDTSIYIHKLRSGFNLVSNGFEELVLSSVVVAELATGYTTRSVKSEEFRKYVEYMYIKNGVITPSFSDWYNSGIIIGKIIYKRPDLKNKKALLSNDCLIALSSKKVNAKVITSNIKDFELLREYINFQVSYQSC